MIRARHAILGGVLFVGLAGGTHAAPLEEAVIPLDQYKSEQARAMAAAHAPQLRQIYDSIYHCLPWLEITKHGLGFRRPRTVQKDDLYLSIWVRVEQVISPEFAAMPLADRASAMFSRYGIELLRRLSSHRELAAEPGFVGYGVVLSWLKPDRATERQAQPMAETLAAFVDKGTVHAFFARAIPLPEFAKQIMVAAFDGKSELGHIQLWIWEDRFVATFKPKGYTPDPSYRC